MELDSRKMKAIAIILIALIVSSLRNYLIASIPYFYPWGSDVLLLIGIVLIVRALYLLSTKPKT